MKEWVKHRNKIRKSLYDIEQALWRARVEAERNSNYHTQIGHAIDALNHLKDAFAVAVPQPNTGGIKSWYTIDELNAWADKYDNITDFVESKALAQPEQEPVAWMDKDGDVWAADSFNAKDKRRKMTPLYTAPPKREWVGLTQKEIDVIYKKYGEEVGYEYEKAIEAKLKKKNT